MLLVSRVAACLDFATSLKVVVVLVQGEASLVCMLGGEERVVHIVRHRNEMAIFRLSQGTAEVAYNVHGKSKLLMLLVNLKLLIVVLLVLLVSRSRVCRGAHDRVFLPRLLMTHYFPLRLVDVDVVVSHALFRSSSGSCRFRSLEWPLFVLFFRLLLLLLQVQSRLRNSGRWNSVSCLILLLGSITVSSPTLSHLRLLSRHQLLLLLLLLLPLLFLLHLDLLLSLQLFLLLTQVFARRLIARDAVMRLVECVSGRRCLEIIQQSLLLLMHLKLTALLCPVHTFAGLVRLSSFQLLLCVPVMLRQALIVHSPEPGLEVETIVHHIRMS